MKPMVTVVIPSYNPARYLIEALDSVFLQTYGHWNIVIVDDASTDKSLAYVKDYLTDKRVKLIRNAVNLGQSRCLNIGLSATTTPYLLQLDADDWLEPDALSILVQAAEQQSGKVGLISGIMNVVIENKHGRPIRSYTMKNRSFQDRYDFLLANVSQWPRFYRTEALMAIGGWPTDDPFEGRYLEDKRVLLRLIEKYHFHWIDVPLYNHRRHLSNQTNRVRDFREITEWMVRNTLERWGDGYEPVFAEKNGWLEVVRLKRTKA